MKRQYLILLFVTVTVTGYGQAQKVGGPCEGCEAIYESPVPFDKLAMFTQLPDATWNGKKPLGVNGIVYKADGKTPAPGVIVYIYHTDETGHYTPKARRTDTGQSAAGCAPIRKASINLLRYVRLRTPAARNRPTSTLP